MQTDRMIRAAQVQDVDQLVAFNLRMAHETEGKQLDIGLLKQGVIGILQDPSHGFYLITEMKGAVVGCLMVTTEWSDWRNGEFWWIQSVYVLPGFRRRGVFRGMHAEVRRRAKSTGNVCGIRLYVERDNQQAQATYTELGFAETDYKMYEETF